MAGIVAIVVTIVKGRWRRAVAFAAAGIGLTVVLVASAGRVEEEEFSPTQGAWLVAVVVWSVLAVVGASRPAAPGSQWARGRALDPSGVPVRAAQPLRTRLWRSVLGALVGAMPAAALMGAVFVSADTGDEAQIAFLGIPLGLLGVGLGGWLGFNWVPRADGRHVGRSSDRDQVVSGVADGEGSGARRTG